MYSEESIQKLNADLDMFEAYTKKIDAQQVDFPLDDASYAVIHQDLMVPVGVVVPYSLATYDQSIEVNINGKRYQLVTTSAT